MAIAGNLRTMQLSELLQWLSTGLKTGTLVVRGAPGEKRIYFNNGRVTSSSSTLEREHLGRFLVGFGFITEEELIRALEVQQESRILLGKILVMIGAIKEDELADLVRLKAAETIYDIFLWTEGSFAFIDGEIPSLPMVPISSDVTGIVMEGLRRYDEWQRIRTRVPTMRVIPSVIMPVEEDLGERDKMILGAANGHRAIDQIALETHNPEFHVAKLMYDLMLTGHVKLVGEREETAAEPVFEDVEVVEESSSFDPLLSGDLHSIPEGVPPAPTIDTFVLAPPSSSASRSPVPTTFNQFLKRRPESGETVARRQSGETAARRAPGDSSGTEPRVRIDAPPPTPAPRTPAPSAAPVSLGSTTRPAAPARPVAPAPDSAGSSPAARAVAPPADASSLSEALPKLPPGAVPILTKPMEDLMSFPFTPSEAFIVSRINGMWDVRSIARISPFPEHEVMRVFHKLTKSGIVSFK
ncbi:MAG TPA: DUF4388 domain-containing protein [Thermoanaerobaculia bacterium]|nr:DUF4388 domain-containing protein [Thermoanaerobaculia bacterium]